jgi:uncharacterized protein YdcH (DUF465 family)
VTIFHTRDNLTVPKDKIVPWAGILLLKKEKLKIKDESRSQCFHYKF